MTGKPQGCSCESYPHTCHSTLPLSRKDDWTAELRIRLKLKSENDRRIEELEEILRLFFPEVR